ncbi:unnamed protein product (macronuclear) [Paramecium tetraurelia]|uniref:Uncharacterized protein n=1 Tax=Paramecium tetraurelia TaxID=5888 RepID=A0CZ79_PARTE|nr:uncharacterized protein GSPATT00011669001 [Paramecium tetraurelia]CAK76096.1 unnamed protein product [Paramecium tetraurelia]|eukprot:XP_001443493.1 hypothetical protein (macronuclear) [Paramecium tetraurelia strain d4-2]
MNQIDQKQTLPPLRVSEIQELLRSSNEQHKKEIISSYRDTKKRKLKEIAEQEKYKVIERKVFNSQSKLQGQTIGKTLDIFLSKEPIIDDYLKRHIIAPQRNLEKGLKDIKTGKNQLLDGRCFGDIPQNKLSKKEKQSQEYWNQYNTQLSEQRYKILLDSQTGLQKKINQQNRLKALKIFVPNKYSPGLFDDHPSQILSFTQMHKHSQPQIWSPNSFYCDSFDESLKQQQQSKSILKLSNTVLKDHSKQSIKIE